MTIQRYSIHGCNGSYRALENEGGMWVLWEDVAELVRLAEEEKQEGQEVNDVL